MGLLASLDSPGSGLDCRYSMGKTFLRGYPVRERLHPSTLGYLKRRSRRIYWSVSQPTWQLSGRFDLHGWWFQFRPMALPIKAGVGYFPTSTDTSFEQCVDVFDFWFVTFSGLTGPDVFRKCGHLNHRPLVCFNVSYCVELCCITRYLTSTYPAPHSVVSLSSATNRSHSKRGQSRLWL